MSEAPITRQQRRLRSFKEAFDDQTTVSPKTIRRERRQVGRVVAKITAQKSTK